MIDAGFRVGDTVQVYQKIKEGDKTRLQMFEGVVLVLNHNTRSFTVRKMSGDVGVERIWALDSPWIEKVDVKKRAAKIRRSKLYYLRDKTPKEVARIVA